MSSAKLKLIHAFGSTCSKKYRNVLSICDEDKNEPKIVFPAGKALAKKYVDRQQMEFVEFSQNTEEIECMTLLPSRTHIAVAEKPRDSNLEHIRIFPLNKGEESQKIKIFHDTDKVGIIKYMVFSASESKFMCALIGQPHNKLIFVDTSKNKPLAESNFTMKDIDQITISPYNSHLICVSGMGFVRLFKVEEYAFKPLEDIRKIPKGRSFTVHCWYKKKMLILATTKSEILIVEEVKPNLYEVKQEYQNIFSESESEEEQSLITAICPFSKGLIVGSSNGKFCLWTRKEDINSLEGDEKLQLTRKWTTTAERASEVTQISMSLKEDLLLISMSNNDIATLNINQILPQISDLITETADKQILFEYLYKGFHNKPITGLDICQQRPLIATCSSEDSTIRVWNYKNFGCKLLRMFYFKIHVKDETQSSFPLITLALHPSGYYMAVGCVDKLRIFHVLNTELRPYREIGVKRAHLVKFSHGGHMMAVCHPYRQELQADHIRVYNALTLQELVSFRDHQSMVKSIQWKNYDECLLSVSENGKVIEWKVSDWSQSKLVDRENKIILNSSIYSHCKNSFIVCGSTSNGVNILEEYGQNARNIEIDMKVSQMLEIPFSKETNFMAMALENGSIVMFGGLSNPAIFSHQNHHVGYASQMILSPCGKYLVSCGNDCMIYVYEISFFNELSEKVENSLSVVVDDFLADVVLVNKKQIAKYTQKEKEFTKVIESLSRKLKILSEQGIKKHRQKVTELELQKNRIIEDINYRIERLNDQIETLKQKNNASLNGLDSKNMSEAEALEKNYEEKIKFEAEKYFQLEQELIQIKVLHQKKLEEMHSEEQEEIRMLKREFEGKFKNSEEVYSDSKRQTSEAESIFYQRLKQIEEEQEDELREIEIKRQKFKLQTAAALEEFHEKLQKLKKEHANLSQQKVDAKNQNQELSFNRRKTEKEVAEAKEKRKDLLSDFDEKIESLKKKESKIVEFEQKISELQKKKHILSYKATEMKKAIEPKEYQIEKLKLDLIKLKKEFESSVERKQKENLELERLSKEKEYAAKCLREEAELTRRESQTIDQIVEDVYTCVEANRGSADNKAYYKELVKLYHKYVEKEQSAQQGSEKKAVEEITKQIVHLEKSLFQMNRSNEKNILRKNDEIFKRTKENTELVNNLNEIKKQNKELVLKIKSKSIEIENLRAAKAELLEKCPALDNVTMKLLTAEDNQLDFSKKPHKSGSMSKLSIKDRTPASVNMYESAISSVSHQGQGQGQGQVKRSPQANFLSSNPNLVNKSSVAGQVALKTGLSTKSKQPVKSSYQKRECEIISEVEFLSEKIHKYEFYLKDMREKLRKHCQHIGCIGATVIDVLDENGA